MKLSIDKEWCLRAAEREEGEVGVGLELTSADQLRPFIKRPGLFRRLMNWAAQLVQRH